MTKRDKRLPEPQPERPRAKKDHGVRPIIKSVPRVAST